MKLGKRFTLVCKMVDSLVEPLLSTQRYDFYAEGFAGRFANSAQFAFYNIPDRAVAEGLIATYNAFAREPDASRLADLQSALAIARRDAPNGSEIVLDLMEEGARHFTLLNDLDAFKDTNEIHVTAAVECMGYWRNRHRGPFEVANDESVHFFKQSGRWEMITDPAIEPVTITVGDKSMSLPIPVVATTSVRSHECPPVQLCDLVAGVLSRAAAAQPTPEFRGFVEEAAKAGFGEIPLFPIEEGGDFLVGPPQRAQGPDAIDQIESAVRRPASRD